MKSYTLTDKELINNNLNSSIFNKEVILPFIPMEQNESFNTNESKSNIKNDSCKSSNTKDPLCVRFLRRKYQCFIIYCLLGIMFLQTITNITSRLDNNTINKLTVLFSKFNFKNDTKYINITEN